MGQVRLAIEKIRVIPAFLGEVDVIRSIQLLPGVSTVGEGATGFNVRGGNVDQNLILLDKAPIYSSSHLFGFFSIFNSPSGDNYGIRNKKNPCKGNIKLWLNTVAGSESSAQVRSCRHCLCSLRRFRRYT